jgi:HEAT repeat protein
MDCCFRSVVSSICGNSVNRASLRSLKIDTGMHHLCLMLALTRALEPAAEERSIAGRPLTAWRELMSRIELRDPDSRRFVPGLIAVMDDDAVPWMTRRQAALTLGRLGALARDAVPAVAKHLGETCADDPEISPQRWALSALALFGREAKDVTPQLIELLRDERTSHITRLGCLEALSQIGPAAPDAIAALWKQLESSLNADEELAVASAQALGMIGPAAAAATPVLMRAAQAADDDLRHEAAQALGRIGVSAQDAQPLLCDLMIGDDSELVRDAAMTALGQTGPTGWPLVEPLLAVENAEIRERAVTVVGHWRVAAKTILPALEPLLADPEPRVRLAAAKSWRSLTGQHQRVWPLLIELLTDADRPVRRGASLELQACVKTGQVSDADIETLRTDRRSAIRTEGVRLNRLQSDAGKSSPLAPAAGERVRESGE